MFCISRPSRSMVIRCEWPEINNRMPWSSTSFCNQDPQRSRKLAQRNTRLLSARTVDGLGIAAPVTFVPVSVTPKTHCAPPAFSPAIHRGEMTGRPTWLRAVGTVRALGRHGRLRHGGPPRQRLRTMEENAVSWLRLCYRLLHPRLPTHVKQTDVGTTSSGSRARIGVWKASSRRSLAKKRGYRFEVTSLCEPCHNSFKALTDWVGGPAAPFLSDGICG